MGTNFYWKELPKELKKYKKLMTIQVIDKDMDPLYHIGKRSAAGQYCKDCGTTFCIQGTARIHYDDNPYDLFSEKYKEAQKYYWYDRCPICGKEGENICSFTWTFMKQKELIESMINCSKKLIKNEYDEEFTPKEFLEEELNGCLVEYQTPNSFC